MLVDFGDKALSAGVAGFGARRDQKPSERRRTRSATEDGSLLCCCRKKKEKEEPETEVSREDKVEMAFKKFDLDGDGYLSWEEFQLMTKTMGKEQATRFFHSGDVRGDGRISLEEFRRMADKQQASNKNRQKKQTIEDRRRY